MALNMKDQIFRDGEHNKEQNQILRFLWKEKQNKADMHKKKEPPLRLNSYPSNL